MIDQVLAALAPGATTKLWLILDGARDERIAPAVQLFAGPKACLYAGALTGSMEATAPHLLQIDRDDRLTRYILEKGWGNAWGVFLHSTASLEGLRRHLRRFLTVKDEDGKRLIFRYYDPRVLRVYLPTCNAEELRTVFGPIGRFLMEDEDPTAVLDFSRNLEVLIENRRQLRLPA